MRVATVHLHSPVHALIAGPAPSVPAVTTIGGTALAMSERGVSALLVGTGGVAIVTERDLTRALALGYSADTPVAEIASPLPVTVSSRTEIVDAAALMLNEEVRHLVVEMPDGSAGILSLRQVMAVLLQAATPEIWLTRLRLSIA